MDIHFITNCEIEPEVDCLVIPAWENEVHVAINSSLINVEDQTSLNLINDRGTISGKDLFYLPTPMSAYRGILILGLGKKEGDLSHKFRNATGKAVGLLQKYKKHHLLLELEHAPDLQTRHFVAAVNLAQYEHTAFKTKSSETIKVDNLCVHLCTSKEITIEHIKANRAQTFTECANYARDLGNAPGNALTPKILAEKARELAKETESEIEVLGETDMEKLGMGALLSVSQGSSEEAQLITLKHTHPSANKTIAIVGKGLTFDAGGTSLKPSKGMQDMKFDMCGAAAVLGAMKIIGQLNPQINVIGVIAATENLPGGDAQRPGDIVTAYNGKQVEILNTDAEGRLILGDALSYVVKEFKPNAVIDLATLTGACITALGHYASGAITNNDAFMEQVRKASNLSGDRVWQLPSFPEYGDSIKGKYGDLQNIGVGDSGTIIGGMFLEHFVDKTPWVHLDIAGTAWNVKHIGYQPNSGATGVGVRLLVDLIQNWEPIK
jgi:leucyl aminopeptidase